MTLYNTLMGWSAALILLVLAGMLRRYDRGERVIPAGTAVVLVVAGAALTFLSGLMAVTWPLNVNPPINIAFAEPCLVLGLFALVGGIVALARPERLDEGTRSLELGIGAVGLPLLFIALAVFRFNLVGDAPDIEPITGQFKGWENTTFGLVYLTAAVACFLTAAHRLRMAARAFALVGVFFLVFASLNYYTHIGMLINIGTGSEYRW
jgi:uncharacterized membrane protein